MGITSQNTSKGLENAMKYFFLSFILTDVLTLWQDGNCLLMLLFGRKHVMLTL